MTFDERASVLYGSMLVTSTTRPMEIGRVGEAHEHANTRMMERGLPAYTAQEVQNILEQFRTVGLLHRWDEEYYLTDRLLLGSEDAR
jgi:hypothetical protein